MSQHPTSNSSLSLSQRQHQLPRRVVVHHRASNSDRHQQLPGYLPAPHLREDAKGMMAQRLHCWLAGPVQSFCRRHHRLFRASAAAHEAAKSSVRRWFCSVIHQSSRDRNDKKLPKFSTLYKSTWVHIESFWDTSFTGFCARPFHPSFSL